MTKKDSIQIPWAFSLAHAGTLPLTGDLHPLKREFAKWLFWSNGLTLVICGGAFLTWFVVSHMEKQAPTAREVKIVRFQELGVPPSIAKSAAPQLNIAQAVAPPSIGVPEPVPDFMAQNTTIATQAEMSEALAPISMSDLGLGGGDSLVVQLETDNSPSPDEFVAVEEMPVRIKIDPPVYPEMAKAAEVEGTVMVRTLVGKDGKVKDTLVVDGHPMLNDAAMACARTAVFKPALQQHRPVEVWVNMPITFHLH